MVKQENNNGAKGCLAAMVVAGAIIPFSNSGFCVLVNYLEGEDHPFKRPELTANVVIDILRLNAAALIFFTQLAHPDAGATTVRLLGYVGISVLQSLYAYYQFADHALKK